MTVKEICYQLSVFCMALFAEPKEKDEELLDPEEIPMVKQEEAEEKRKRIQQEFNRLAFGGMMGEVISWGPKEKEKDREEFMQTYGRGGTDI
jgi:hypothetical protein